MKRKRMVMGLAALGMLAAGAARAQAWRGTAALEVEVHDRGKRPVAGAEVTLEFVDIDPKAGPAPAVTDNTGKAYLGGLAEGRWVMEVRYQGTSPYSAVLRLEANRRAVVIAGPVRDAAAPPLNVKFLKAKARPGPAPLPPPPRPEPPRPEPRGPEPTPSRPPPSREPPAPPVTPPAAPKPAPTPSAEAEPSPAPAQAPAAPPSATIQPAPEPAPAPPSEEVAAPPETVPAPQPEIAAPPPTHEPAPAVPAEIAPPPEPAPAVPPEVAPPPMPEPAPEPPAAPEPMPSAPPPEPSPAPTPARGPQPPAPEPIAPAPEPVVPAPQPAAPPPAAEPMPQPPPLPHTLRSSSSGTCPECGTGEWAVSAELAAAPGRGGDCGASAAAREAMTLLASGAAPAFHRYAGPLLDPASGQVVAVATADARAQAAARLAPYVDPAAPCQVLAVVLPEGARFRGYGYEVGDTQSAGACVGSEECDIGQARWLSHPVIERVDEGTLLYAVFQNRSPDRERRARLTVYFTPPRGGWPP